MSLSAEDLTKLCELIQSLYDERITSDDLARLEDWVCRDKEACRVYAQYMNLCASIQWDKTQDLAPPVAPTPPGAPAPSEEIDLCKILLEENDGGLPPAPEARPPVLGFLGDVFRAGGDFLSRSFVLTLLLTVGLPAVLLAILLIQIGTQPQLKPPAAVATITQMHRCIWEDGGAPASGFGLPPGERIQLREGLVELAFTGGAKAILQGPATFEATSGARGFLSAGALVANVPKGSEGFTVQTPAIVVVDLGTEFGVRADRQRKAADIEVFQGKVELRTAAKEPSQTLRHPLEAGQAASVEVADQQGGPTTIRPIAPLANSFVRQMPGPIIADFSGGMGNTRPDQFPGAAGAGWAGGWTCPEATGIHTTIAVERRNPVLDGGDYLRVLVERAPDAPPVQQGIERPLAMGERVDLARPYVISFTVRVDSLRGFDRTSANRFAMCSVGKFHAGDGGARSGWRIQFGARDIKGVKARHWYFVPGDGKGGWKILTSGVAVREGECYLFRVLFDPVAGQWTPSIAVEGGPWTTFSPMLMRSGGTPEDLDYWSRLYFYWVLQNKNRETESEKISFSIDSIRIAPVAEE